MDQNISIHISDRSHINLTLNVYNCGNQEVDLERVINLDHYAIYYVHEGVGYVIAMVADGYIQSFRNMMEENGLMHIFAATSISEEFGQEKPSQVLFEKAMERLGLDASDKRGIIMVGNNVERDMAGAKRFGIRSVQLVWSRRHPYEPACQEEPDYRIYSPRELLPLAVSGVALPQEMALAHVQVENHTLYVTLRDLSGKSERRVLEVRGSKLQAADLLHRSRGAVERDWIAFMARPFGIHVFALRPGQ